MDASHVVTLHLQIYLQDIAIDNDDNKKIKWQLIIEKLPICKINK